jgi:hypothetical protein
MFMIFFDVTEDLTLAKGDHLGNSTVFQLTLGFEQANLRVGRSGLFAVVPES